MRLQSPISSLPNQRQIWSWISFDIANQSFTLIINTLLFSRYFMEVVLSKGTESPNTKWSLIYASSMVLTVLASPIAGAMADERGLKKVSLISTGLVCALMTCGLALIGPGAVWIAILLYIPANFCFNLGENFLASFLPELAERKDFGRLSGFSWACAYGAALLLLCITVAAMIFFKLDAPESWRPLFIFAGVWFLGFSIPTMLFLKEKPSAPHVSSGESLLLVGFHRLGRTISEIPKYRDLALLMVASFFYGVAMQVIIAFASKLANDYGFSSQQMVIFLAVITISGIVGTLVPTLIQDRFGHRRTTVCLLLVWLAVSILFAMYARLHASNVAAGLPTATWPLWVLGNLIGFGLGSLGAANRAFVGFLTPADRTAEFFGVWGLVFKLAAIGTIPFAAARDHLGDFASFLILAGFVLLGLLVTLAVRENPPQSTKGNASLLPNVQA